MSVLFFMDSGLGGLPYLHWIQKKKPEYRLIYLADNQAFPYGIRSEEFLQERLSLLSGTIIDLYNPALMVIACNTASVSALHILRQRFNIPFVGVVPAVKPAAEASGEGVIGVLATQRTVQGDYLKDLIRQFAPDQKVETQGAPDLVDFVENRLFSATDEEINAILDPYIEHIARQKWNRLVLGCTHFILLRPWLEQRLPGSVGIVDSTEGVGQRILSLLEENEKKNTRITGNSGTPVTEKGQRGVFHITGTGYNKKAYQAAADRYDLDFRAIKEIG
ncbi:MAG: glutamate racemase [Spirochaetales bacterium]|nr:glutamate racemase [Spirochaetales bacterium]